MATKTLILINLPFDVSRKMMIEQMTVRDILSLCGTDKVFNQKVCTDDFWHSLAIKKFAFKSKGKHKTWKDLVIQQDYLKELERRVKDLINYITTKSGIKLLMTKGSKYWTVKGGGGYGENTQFRVVISTGDLLGPSTNKVKVNILQDPYGGKGNFNPTKEDHSGSAVPRMSFYPLGVQDLPKYESITLTKKEEEPIKSKYTTTDLKDKSKAELVRIYKGLRLLGSRDKNIRELKASILGEKPEKPEEEKRIEFSQNQNLVAQYFDGHNTKHIFGKVISVTKAGNPIIQLYKKEIVVLHSGIEYITKVRPINELTNEIYIGRYSKKNGYTMIIDDSRYYINPQLFSFGFNLIYNDES